MRIISKFRMGVLSFCVMMLASCSALDEIRSEIDEIQEHISDLENAVKALEDAYAGGKVVTSVESADYNGGGGIFWPSLTEPLCFCKMAKTEPTAKMGKMARTVLHR